MDQNIEGQVPQKTPEGGVPQTPTVTLTQAELDDLKHRAEVSSQNFQRLKKAEEENERLRTELEINSVSLEPTDLRVNVLADELSEVKAQLQKREVLERHPMLKEMWADLEEFRNNPDNKGMNLNTAAKAFMVEKGLLEPQRQGLEKTTGGPRAPVSSGMTVEEVANLRNTDYRKYSDMIRKGQIKLS